MPPIPKNRGRPCIYPKGEKAKVDVVNRRLRRRAQATAARQNNIRFQIYTAEQVQVEPSIPHQGHFQLLNNLDILADAATSQVIMSQLAKILDPSNETRGPTVYDKELLSSYYAALLSLGSYSTIPKYELVYAPLDLLQLTSLGS
ncbi:hypothetical protein V490_08655 [Pseudogymnoascus sp. VKM F-3557]|nr:hypothetical protein V490_08655 [Pseudogymnoascus sp. VKM F-3557]